MMGALDELRAEHETILGILREAEETANDPTQLAGLVEFIRRFVRQRHHAKEERVLFPRMRAEPFLKGMAEILHDEHEEGEKLVAEIERGLEQQGDQVAARRAIRWYKAFLEDHIARENEMIFEAVESVLDDDTIAEMLAEFRQIQNEAEKISR